MAEGQGIPFNELDIDLVFQMDYASFQQMLQAYGRVGVSDSDLKNLERAYLQNRQLEESGNSESAAEHRANIALTVGTATTLASPFLAVWANNALKNPTTPERVRQVATAAQNRYGGSIPSTVDVDLGSPPLFDGGTPPAPGGVPNTPSLGGAAPSLATPATALPGFDFNAAPLPPETLPTELDFTAGLQDPTYTLPGPELVDPTGYTHHGWLGGLQAAPGTSVLGSTTAGSFLPYLGVPAGLAVGQQQLSGLMNAVEGDDLSLAEQAALFLPTGGASLLYNPVKDWITGAPHPERADRDRARGMLGEQHGLFTPGDTWTVNVGDQTYDLGQDELHPGGRSYNIDWKDPLALDLVGNLAPLTYSMFDTDKLRHDVTGDLLNAAMNVGGDPGQNIASYYQTYNQNFDDPLSARNEIGSGIWRQFEAGNMTEQQRDAALARNDLLYGVDNPNASEEDRRRQQEDPLFRSALG